MPSLGRPQSATSVCFHETRLTATGRHQPLRHRLSSAPSIEAETGSSASSFRSSRFGYATPSPHPVFLNPAATPLIEMWMPFRTRSFTGSPSLRAR